MQRGASEDGWGLSFDPHAWCQLLGLQVQGPGEAGFVGDESAACLIGATCHVPSLLHALMVASRNHGVVRPFWILKVSGAELQIYGRALANVKQLILQPGKNVI